IDLLIRESTADADYALEVDSSAKVKSRRVLPWADTNLKVATEAGFRPRPRLDVQHGGDGVRRVVRIGLRDDELVAVAYRRICRIPDEREHDSWRQGEPYGRIGG